MKMTNIMLIEAKFLEIKEINRNDRFIQYGLIASKMAVEDAGLMTIR